MEAPVPGRPFLGIGREAPRPSGPEDYQLKKAMLREARAKTFRFRVNLWCWIRDLWSCLWGQGRWSWLTELGRFDWDGFETRLEESEFRAFATFWENIAGGWAGLGTNGKWLFGVAACRVAPLRRSVMRHELFHAVQDSRLGIFQRRNGLIRSFAIEYSAHLWGGPLIGLPLAYGGTFFIVVSLVSSLR